MTRYYTYNPTTKSLTVAPRVIVEDGRTLILGTAADYARYLGAYPLAPAAPAPEPPEGRVAVPDGYALQDGAWVRSYRYEDAPAPTIADFDAAMEDHLRAECEARGYTTREPDAYLNSEVPRWASDARDWVRHRDKTMMYALEIMNAVEAGEREPPTLAEFRAGLPAIQWSVAANALDA